MREKIGLMGPDEVFELFDNMLARQVPTKFLRDVVKLCEICIDEGKGMNSICRPLKAKAVEQIKIREEQNDV